MEFANYTRFIDQGFAQFLGLGVQATDVLVAVVILAVFAVLTRLTAYVPQERLPRFTAKTQTTLDDELVKALQGPIKILIILTGLALAVHSLEFGTLYFEPFDIIVTILYILLGAYLVSNVVHALIQWYSNDIAPKTKSRLDDQLMPFLDKVDRIVILTDRPFKIGDRIELSETEIGDVTDIGVRI
jgi:MscS family membrane protein